MCDEEKEMSIGLRIELEQSLDVGIKCFELQNWMMKKTCDCKRELVCQGQGRKCFAKALRHDFGIR